jgi:hypothetical protein
MRDDLSASRELRERRLLLPSLDPDILLLDRHLREHHRRHLQLRCVWESVPCRAIVRQRQLYLPVCIEADLLSAERKLCEYEQ